MDAIQERHLAILSKIKTATSADAVCTIQSGETDSKVQRVQFQVVSRARRLTSPLCEWPNNQPVHLLSLSSLQHVVKRNCSVRQIRPFLRKE